MQQTYHSYNSITPLTIQQLKQMFFETKLRQAFNVPIHSSRRASGLHRRLGGTRRDVTATRQCDRASDVIHPPLTPFLPLSHPPTRGNEPPSHLHARFDHTLKLYFLQHFISYVVNLYLNFVAICVPVWISISSLEISEYVF